MKIYALHFGVWFFITALFFVWARINSDIPERDKERDEERGNVFNAGKNAALLALASGGIHWALI